MASLSSFIEEEAKAPLWVGLLLITGTSIVLWGIIIEVTLRWMN
jgi:hypothetical protein